ncbi:T9SS type A sorting domain-containing protein [bacterium]|nr:T9SS type A sorting domain-containing protein [bacterium]
MNSLQSVEWSVRWGGYDDDFGNALGLDVQNNLWCIRGFRGVAYMNPATSTADSLVALGMEDVFISKFNQCPLPTVMQVAGCDSYYWPVNQQNYAASGTYYDTLTSASSCDSVLQLNLTLSSTDSVSSAYTACGSYFWNGTLYTASGTYTDTLVHSSGCDSIVTLHLTVLSIGSGTLTDTACGSYFWNGTLYTASGTYTDTHVQSSGCDSLVTLNLYIDSVSDRTVSLQMGVLVAHNTQAEYQWLDCSNQFVPIPGQTMATFQPLANGMYAVQLIENGCIDTSDCISITGIGLSETLNRRVLIAPNPHTETLNVRLPYIVGLCTVRIYDAWGRELYQVEHRFTDTLELEWLGPPGIYFVEVMADQNHWGRFKVLRE